MDNTEKKHLYSLDSEGFIVYMVRKFDMGTGGNQSYEHLLDILHNHAVLNFHHDYCKLCDYQSDNSNHGALVGTSVLVLSDIQTLKLLVQMINNKDLFDDPKEYTQSMKLLSKLESSVKINTAHIFHVNE